MVFGSAQTTGCCLESPLVSLTVPYFRPGEIGDSTTTGPLCMTGEEMPPLSVLSKQQSSAEH